MSYKTPCGRTTGHGDYCGEGYLCGACEEIRRLRTEKDFGLSAGLTAEYKAAQKALNKAAEEALVKVGALRQYRHNYGFGLVFAYDKVEADKVIGDLQRRLADSEKDAARYRWLRVQHNSRDSDWFVYAAASKSLDEDVDAAIKERKA